jgi:hypothetical protein
MRRLKITTLFARGASNGAQRNASLASLRFQGGGIVAGPRERAGFEAWLRQQTDVQLS